MIAADVTAMRLVAHVRDCNACRPAFSFDTLCDQGQNLTIGARMHDRQRQLAGNDLVTLHECMIADPSIPSHRCGAVCNCELQSWELDLLRQA